jgi:diguanylate cyclase (GGDEF)-like protein
MDVDGLKEINDRLGHGAGDVLLRDLVEALRSRLRPYDPVVRWGGDEFVCALSGTDLKVAADRFDQALGVLAESQPAAAISVGLAALRDGDTLETLWEQPTRFCRTGASGRRRHPQLWVDPPPGSACLSG